VLWRANAKPDAREESPAISSICNALGESPEYTAADGIQASPAGANVIADGIWATMRDDCIEP
jgi:hypothetical protein